MHISDIVYRNTDKFVIEKLLQEIGRHTLAKECELKRLPFPKRIRLFYLESNDDCTFLKYRYPRMGERAIMKLDRYGLPEGGWVRVKLQGR